MNSSPSFPPPLPDPSGHDFPSDSVGNDIAPSPQTHDLVWRTMREALMMFGFNLVLGGAISALGWKFFLPSAQNSESIAALLKNPALLLLLGVVVAPLWEEAAFRGLPSLLLRRVRRDQNQALATRDIWFWTLCIVSSFAFAIVHGANDKGEIHLPLPQLVMGFFLWRIAIERGLRFSILLHATYNAIAVGLVLLAGNAVKMP